MKWIGLLGYYYSKTLAKYLPRRASWGSAHWQSWAQSFLTLDNKEKGVAQDVRTWLWMLTLTRNTSVHMHSKKEALFTCCSVFGQGFTDHLHLPSGGCKLWPFALCPLAHKLHSITPVNVYLHAHTFASYILTDYWQTDCSEMLVNWPNYTLDTCNFSVLKLSPVRITFSSCLDLRD